jgi:hypothetical protein
VNNVTLRRTLLDGIFAYHTPLIYMAVVKAGEGYVDTGHGYIGRNETGNSAKDVAVVIAPVGAPFPCRASGSRPVLRLLSS